MNSRTDEIAAKYLGKKTEGSYEYNPDFLVAVPREENRKHYNIDSSNLPFLGFDIWHSFEFSAMTEKSVPVTKILKIKYNCENKYIIESKSLKLYLNSFNMRKIGSCRTECLDICKKDIINDLNSKLKTNTEIEFIDNNSKRLEIFKDFDDITKYINEKELNISKFKESPELLKVELNETLSEYRLFFDSLRSNCRVTHQPDFGTVFIHYKSKKHIKESSLVEYLVSFRSEYHFHEECCEMIYKRLYDLLDKDDELMVCALYTRRGGINICPVRYSKNYKPDKNIENLLNTGVYAEYGLNL